MLRTTCFALCLGCLVASLIAAPPAAPNGNNHKGNEMKLRTAEEESSEDKEGGAKADNGILQSIFGTLLAFPNYVAAGLEGLLNGVVGRILGNGQKFKTSDSEDFR